MRHKKLIIICCSILFFLTALTFYLNRVVLPHLIKNTVIQHAEDYLKRHVEIDTIRFNWMRGFVIDKVKVYQKDSTDTVLAQAEQVSFGIIFIPGFKQHKITIPFIKLSSPSIHLIRTGESTWNFSDLLIPQASPQGQKPSPFVVSLGGVSILHGKLRVDDITLSPTWSEMFDHIELTSSLSYKGITFDFKTDIPSKAGLLAAKGTYQPLTQNTIADIHLKNIDIASYLSLVKIPSVQLTSGHIDNLDMTLEFSNKKITASGNAKINQINATLDERNFKGQVSIHGLEAQLADGDWTGKGQITLTQASLAWPGLEAAGDVRAIVKDFGSSNDIFTFDGSLYADGGSLKLGEQQHLKSTLSLENIKLRRDKEGWQGVGTILAKGLDVGWDNHTFTGDVTLKPLTLRINNDHHVSLEGDINAQNVLATLDPQKTFSGQVLASDIKLNMTDLNDLTVSLKLFAENAQLSLDHGTKARATFNADKCQLQLSADTLRISTSLTAPQAHLELEGNKIIDANPQLQLNLIYPFKTPEEMTYDGSLTIGEGRLQGFGISHSGPIEFDADFKTNEATVNALTIRIFDTDVRASGTITNFNNPELKFNAQASELDLAKINDIAPHIVAEYGLTLSGTSSVKLQFEGLAHNPMAGKILGVASLSHVDVASSKFNQRIDDITGIIEATPNSLKWRDFTGTYLNKKYTLTGQLDDFKNPKASTTLDGEDVKLTATIQKDGDTVAISEFTGQYLNILFGIKGSIDLLPSQPPVLNLNSNTTFRLEDLLNFMPDDLKKNIVAFKPSGLLTVDAHIKGPAPDWKNWTSEATVTCPLVTVMGYKLEDLKLTASQSNGKINNLVLDGALYDGTVHAVGSIDLNNPSMPFDLALNINASDLHKFKLDSPYKSEEINGKFYLTSVSDGALTNIKNAHAKGSLAIREGFLAEFNLFKGLLSVLNEALRLGQVMITNVESNFTLEDQRVSTENLRLKSPTIVLLGKGWVHFDQTCDLTMTVDLSSGIVPPIAQDVLSTLSIRIYDKISNPKYSKKISVPEVINSILRNILQ